MPAGPNYGYAHRKERKRLERIIATQGYTCTRCHHYRPPGSPFDLDHDDHNPTAWLGPACPPCNRGAGGRKARARQNAHTPHSRDW